MEEKKGVVEMEKKEASNARREASVSSFPFFTLSELCTDRRVCIDSIESRVLDIDGYSQDE